MVEQKSGWGVTRAVQVRKWWADGNRSRTWQRGAVWNEVETGILLLVSQEGWFWLLMDVMGKYYSGSTEIPNGGQVKQQRKGIERTRKSGVTMEAENWERKENCRQGKSLLGETVHLNSLPYGLIFFTWLLSFNWGNCVKIMN